MTDELARKVAIVTGGAGGIGGAIATELAARGASVVLFDRAGAGEAADAYRDLLTPGAEALGIEVELTDEAQVVAAVRRTLDRMGRIDVLVNCAGLAQHEPLERVSAASWRAVLDANLTASFLVSREVAPAMCERGWGRIVNIGSEQALLGDPGLVHYTAAKAGLIALTRSFAIRYAPTVNVNLVAPGPVDTPKFRKGPHYDDHLREQLLLRRWGEPRDVALSVAFLVGQGGDYYTGQQLDPNGGAGLPVLHEEPSPARA
ncbi:MAG: SDR family oxidoreductase [Actinobacteria bacterium]|nr:SDR family oxidoreductase [Actinomycetota bacterium]